MVRVAAFVVPFLISVVVVRLVGGYLYRADGWLGFLGWIAQAALIGAAVSFVVQRGTRRLLPLAAMLDLSLVFPDQAPARFSLALRAGSVRRLNDRLDEIRRDGLGKSEDEAAATALELVHLLSAHDRLTRGHSERVRAYADLIAEEMNVSKPDRLRLAWGVILHDTGKLSVPPEILNKTGKLTDDEWELLKGHPAAGVELLEPLSEWLGEWLQAASEHHERWDGKGYPDGLMGHEISLAGRITAVADAYDVITSKRSYKAAMSPEAAREELVACSGAQFDPRVVRAFLAVSVGRRATFGPLAWLSDLPLGNLGSTIAHAPAMAVSGAVVAVSSLVVMGPPEPPELLADASPVTSVVVAESLPQPNSTVVASRREPSTTGASTSSDPRPTSTNRPSTTGSSTTAASSSTTRPSTTRRSSTTRPSTTRRSTTTRRRTTSTASTTSATTAAPSTTSTTQTSPTFAATTVLTTTTVPGSLSFGGHSYLAGTPGQSWHEAQAEAIALGGYLVAVNSAAENAFIANNFAQGRAVWLGLSDADVEGSFEWESGEPLTFTNWSAGQPDNFGGNQDYASMINPQGDWDDGYGDEALVYENGQWQPGDFPAATIIEFD